MKFHELFTIRIDHEGYVDTLCTDGEIVPRARTQDANRILVQKQLIIKHNARGISVLYAHESVPMRMTFSGALLSFDLYARGTEFALRTSTDAVRAHAFPTFCNVGLQSVLQLMNAERPLPLGSFAGVAVSEISSEWLKHPPQFQIALEGRRLPWVFYVCCDPKKGAPRIVSSASEPLFVTEQLDPATGNPGDDPVARMLLQQQRERTWFRIATDRPVPIIAPSNQRLSLLQGDAVICDALPAPGVQHRSHFVPGGSSTRQESAFYVVPN